MLNSKYWNHLIVCKQEQYLNVGKKLALTFKIYNK